MEVTNNPATYTVSVYPCKGHKLDPQMPFGLLLQACMAERRPAAYHGDLYHDAIFIKELCESLDLETPEPTGFDGRVEVPVHKSKCVWVLRDCGTAICREPDSYSIKYWIDNPENIVYTLWLERTGNYSYRWRLEAVR